MAFTTILRRSISSFVPLAVRVVRRNHHHSALFTAVYHSSFTQKHSLRPFSSARHSSAVEHSSNGKLIRALEEEIKCAEETDDPDTHEEAPDGFPFELQDNPGEVFVYLTREYQGEVIKVEVGMPDLVTGVTDGDYDNDNDDEKGNQSKIPLVVSVSKKNGSFLEFSCSAYPDEITIDSLSIKNPELSEEQIAYEGPDFADLDENLQKAFHKFLEIRGIKPSTTNFLHEYMINKDSREYLLWLKNVKKFVES